MRTFFLALLFVLPGVGWATDISVGGVSVTIPNPIGFSPVTQQMTSLYELQKQFVAPVNKEFATFIPERDVSAALKDDFTRIPRRFTVQTAKSLIGVTVSASDFVQLMNIIKLQNDGLMKKVEQQLPRLMETVNERITKKYNVDRTISVSRMMTMPVHKETDRTLAYSALRKYDMMNENGNPAPFVAGGKATFVHVKGKVLFLYTYAEESGLEWSKQASQEWADAVVAANSSDHQATVKEALSTY